MISVGGHAINFGTEPEHLTTQRGTMPLIYSETAVVFMTAVLLHMHAQGIYTAQSSCC